MKKAAFYVTILCLMALPAIWIVSGESDVVARYATPSIEYLATHPRSGASLSQGVLTVTGPGGQSFLLWEKGAAFLIPAEPFLQAGLDPEQLPDTIRYDASEQRLLIGDIPEEGEERSASEILTAFLEVRRPALGYHAALGHFGISVGEDDGITGGGKFEWAQHPTSNNKDVVFILDPRPFERAGVRPTEVEGWFLLNLDVSMAKKAPRLASPYEFE
jgi:hypothetical protein